MADQTATISDTSVVAAEEVPGQLALIANLQILAQSYQPSELEVGLEELVIALFTFEDVDVINTLLESMITSDSFSTLADVALSLSETMVAISNVVPGLHADLSDTVIQDVVSQLNLTPLPITETITASQALNLIAELSGILSENAVARSVIQPIQQAYQAEVVVASATEVIQRALAALVSEVLVTTKATIANIVLNISVAEVASVSEQLEIAYVELVNEVTTLVKAINTSMWYTGALSELVIASTLLSHIINSTNLITELLGVEASHNLTLEFTQAISELVKSDFVVELGGSDYTALVFNTETEAPFFYSNFPFNSFSGNLAATSEGIYRLEGDTDDGTDIDAYFETGYSDFGTSQMKRFQPGGVYIGFANDGSAVVKVSTSNNGIVEEDWYEEDVTFSAFDTERLKVHDGVKSRYWKFKVLNKDGSHLDLDTLQLYPIVLNRRLR